jgi:hypothetical protein
MIRKYLSVIVLMIIGTVIGVLLQHLPGQCDQSTWGAELLRLYYASFGFVIGSVWENKYRQTKSESRG